MCCVQIICMRLKPAACSSKCSGSVGAKHHCLQVLPCAARPVPVAASPAQASLFAHVGSLGRQSLSGSVLQPVAGAGAAGSTPRQSAACSRTPASGVQGPRPGQTVPRVAGTSPGIAQPGQQESEPGSAQAEEVAALELGGAQAAGSGPTEAEAGPKAELLAAVAAEVPGSAVPAAAVLRLAGRRGSAPAQRRALAATPGVAYAARHRCSMPAGGHLPAQQAGSGGRASGSPRLLIVSRPSSRSPAAACDMQSAQQPEAQQALSNVAQVAGAEDGGQVGAAGCSGWP